MRFRQKFLGFSGGAMVALGLVLTILGKDTAYLNEGIAAPAAGIPVVNGAAGVPMWTGILIIICGMANITEAFDGKKKRGPTPYELPFSMTVFVVNFLALAVTGICMGMLSWAIYSVYLQPTLVEDTRQQAVIGLYATIIVACCLIFIFALMAMFVDCCINGFIGGLAGMPPPGDHTQRESPYDTYQSRPAMLYK
ncbi:uncharacterized protein LOC115918934 [Strongylocentrotus purpuratus]|uniref:Uncharacterized protein n=1 Tax=Strongylocentrotus purpuratus TaxID=7668 RepID=A0A7M7PFE9_STRPU|nr:uncharacterized protein LOC115918934 [Strongylocentrotus purpuratus]